MWARKGHILGLYGAGWGSQVGFNLEKKLKPSRRLVRLAPLTALPSSSLPQWPPSSPTLVSRPMPPRGAVGRCGPSSVTAKQCALTSTSHITMPWKIPSSTMVFTTSTSHTGPPPAQDLSTRTRTTPITGASVGSATRTATGSP